MPLPDLMSVHNVQTILAHLTVGKSIPQAAAKAGLHEDTVAKWIKRGNVEKTRLEALGVSTDEIDLEDIRILPNERRYFGFSRSASIAKQHSAADVLDTLYRASTEGVEETRTVTTMMHDDETGQDVVISEHTTRTRKIDLTTARWLAERMDPERLHLPTNVTLAGPGGEAIEIAGMSTNQAEALAVYTRTLIDGLLAIAPQRTRERMESKIPEALQAALDAIEAREITT